MTLAADFKSALRNVRRGGVPRLKKEVLNGSNPSA